MAKPIRPSPNLSYAIEVRGARRPGPADLYHWLLRIRWWQAFTVIAGVYVFWNVVFGAIYLAIGGIDRAAPGSFLDAFFFSVQTFGTIGYGSMTPVTHLANAVVTLESIISLVTTALATGLVFVRFSLVKSRIVFSRRVAIGPMDGVPTLMVRIGNDRANSIFDAQMRATLMINSPTTEGIAWYRSADLVLVRDRASALARSFTVLHKIDDRSPLNGMTPETLRQVEAELTIAVSGVDDTSLQMVHARWVYEADAFVFGARLADVLSDTPGGNMVLDLARFHDLVPTDPIPGFPHRAAL